MKRHERLTNLSEHGTYDGEHLAFIWVAYDREKRIQGAWWLGCAQSNRSWRAACKRLGWRTTQLAARSQSFMPVW